jgi:DNA-binding CsgD family transcriptional regulator
MVAAFVATGMEYKEAARILGMSHQMIKNTCQILFDKTGTDNRLRLVLFLIDQGIIQKPMRLPI